MLIFAALNELEFLGSQLVEGKSLGSAAALAKAKESHEATEEELSEATEFCRILDGENEKLQAQIEVF